MDFKFVTRFWNWSICGNVWLWFHVLAGAIGAKVFHLFLNRPASVAAVLVCALGWEIIEYGKDDVVKIYGSRARWFYDSLGDVLGAVVMAVVVVL